MFTCKHIRSILFILFVFIVVIAVGAGLILYGGFESAGHVGEYISGAGSLIVALLTIYIAETSLKEFFLKRREYYEQKNSFLYEKYLSNTIKLLDRFELAKESITIVRNTIDADAHYAPRTYSGHDALNLLNNDAVALYEFFCQDEYRICNDEDIVNFCEECLLQLNQQDEVAPTDNEVHINKDYIRQDIEKYNIKELPIHNYHITKEEWLRKHALGEEDKKKFVFELLMKNYDKILLPYIRNLQALSSMLETISKLEKQMKMQENIHLIAKTYFTAEEDSFLDFIITKYTKLNYLKQILL